MNADIAERERKRVADAYRNGTLTHPGNGGSAVSAQISYHGGLTNAPQPETEIESLMKAMDNVLFRLEERLEGTARRLEPILMPATTGNASLSGASLCSSALGGRLASFVRRVEVLGDAVADVNSRIVL